MRFCPTFCPMRKENFIEGILDWNAFGSCVYGVQGTFCANGTSNEMEVIHG